MWSVRGRTLESRNDARANAVQKHVEPLCSKCACGRDNAPPAAGGDDPVLGRLEQGIAVIAAEPTRVGNEKNPQQPSGKGGGGHFDDAGTSINAFSRAVDTIAAKRTASSLATWRPTRVIS